MKHYNLPGEISDKRGNNQPEQTFDQEKQKSRDAEAFYPS